MEKSLRRNQNRICNILLATVLSSAIIGITAWDGIMRPLKKSYLESCKQVAERSYEVEKRIASIEKELYSPIKLIDLYPRRIVELEDRREALYSDMVGLEFDLMEQLESPVVREARDYCVKQQK